MRLFSRSVFAPVTSCALLLALASACGPGTGEPSGTGTSASSEGGGGPGSGGSAGSGGAGDRAARSALDLDTILGELRADTSGALAKHAGESGWPVPVLAATSSSPPT